MPYLFTSESVSEGHPDKLCDRVSDTVLDLFLAQEPEARVACETFATTNRVIIGGEVRASEDKMPGIMDSIESAVRGAILCDGPGLTGGGPQPGRPHIIHPDPRSTACPDSFALAEFCTDVRPPDYAQSFVRQIDRLSRVERPLTVCAVQRAPWLDAVVNDPETETRSLHEALDAYSEPGLREVDPS